MKEKRKIIIGDVHGCIEELMCLLDKVDYSSEDDLYFAGDVINKGPYSLMVLELILELEATLILGNHEIKFLQCLEGKCQTNRFDNLIDEMADDLDFWFNWLSSCPLYINEKDFILVHAGIEPGKTVEQSHPKHLTTIRTWDGEGLDTKNEENPPWFDFYKDDKLIVFGHWAKRGLVNLDNAIGLDTGCVYGNSLSALILPEREIISVPAAEAYCSID